MNLAVLIRPPRLRSDPAREGIVDQMGALQMVAALAVISDLQRRVACPKLFWSDALHCCDVLRRRVGIEGR